jgi:N-acetylmuramoyl-L-alanine amidase
MAADEAKSQPVAAVPLAASAQPIAQGASLGGDQKRTRFIADLSKPVAVNVFTLGDPYRVIIELPQVNFQLPQGLGTQGHGLVKAYRYGLFAPGKSRIVLDVTGPVIIESSVVSEAKGSEPARLTIDLVPTDRTTFLAGQSRQLMASVSGELPFKLGRPPLSKEKAKAGAKKPLIVIDPGHGGHDSGATKNGAIEKDVVLAFGIALREKLLATGRYEVLMTRDTDKFVDLDERRDFARRHNAALFMAIHADYVPGNNARGATIYTLRESMANSMAKPLDKDGGGDLLAGVQLDAARQVEGTPDALKGILKDLALRENKPTKERTSFFAKNVIQQMGQTTELKQQPHREAAFRVLMSAQVPSVLIELAYVSNREDAANLKSDAWRDRVSASLVSAVNRYFNLTLLPL